MSKFDPLVKSGKQKGIAKVLKLGSGGFYLLKDPQTKNVTEYGD